MLPRSRRLRAHEVAEVLKRGRTVRVGPYQGKLLAASHALRVAVIVPKRVARKATARNALRRAAYRSLASLSLPSEGLLAVFVQSNNS
jgi:ribonuclease P protein component